MLITGSNLGKVWEPPFLKYSITSTLWLLSLSLLVFCGHKRSVPWRCNKNVAKTLFLGDNHCIRAVLAAASQHASQRRPFILTSPKSIFGFVFCFYALKILLERVETRSGVSSRCCLSAEVLPSLCIQGQRTGWKESSRSAAVSLF